jgi:hypothetical protein
MGNIVGLGIITSDYESGTNGRNAHGLVQLDETTTSHDRNDSGRGYQNPATPNNCPTLDAGELRTGSCDSTCKRRTTPLGRYRLYGRDK